VQRRKWARIAKSDTTKAAMATGKSRTRARATWSVKQTAVCVETLTSVAAARKRRVVFGRGHCGLWRARVEMVVMKTRTTKSFI
jgi:tRNA C32,U32 (ribose-2'-O)-methylase TrmJ